MKRFSILLLAAVLSLTASAQNAAQMKAADSLYMCDIYRPYPVPTAIEQTPAPKGYTPFYISHLGRHGSRWQTSDKTYESAYKYLRRAHEAGELTALGERAYCDMTAIVEDAKERYGELSPQGADEHRGIARRMYASYPEVFAAETNGGKCSIDARSTVVPRCILSMTNFTAELLKLNPALDITFGASQSNAYYMAAYAHLNAVKAELVGEADSVRTAMLPSAERFMNALFKPDSKVAAKIKSPKKYMQSVYVICAGVRSAHSHGLNLLDYLLTDDEMFESWRAMNVRRYILTGPSAKHVDDIMVGAKPMLRDIIAHADSAVAGDGECATLRFAHDVNIIPVAYLLGVSAGSFSTADYAVLHSAWVDSEVSPMAANFQLVFYRNAKGEVLVKVLFCEREQTLPTSVGKSVNGVYYKWSDLRRFLTERSK